MTTKLIGGMMLMGALSLTVSAHANPTHKNLNLIPDEHIVCDTADQCIDILSRHGPHEFDYRVLAAEFRRMDGAGLSGLLAFARDGEPEPLIALIPHVDPALALALFDPLISDPATHKIAAKLIARARIDRVADADLPRFDPAALAAVMAIAPSENLLRLTLKLPPETAREALRTALASDNPAIVGKAYAALFSISPDLALRALLDQAAQTTAPDKALAIAETLGARARSTRSRFYPETLDQMATDPALPQAMQDAARLVSLQVGGNDVQLTLDSGFTDQLMRLFAIAPDQAVQRTHLERHGRALLPAWAALAEREPAAREAVLMAMQDVNMNDRYRAQTMRQALAAPYASRSVYAALWIMSGAEAALYEDALETLATDHPWDTVRYVARQKRAGDDRAGLFAGWHVMSDRFRAERNAAAYCVRGEAIDIEGYNDQLPPLLPFVPETTRTAHMTRPWLRTSFPTATRWLVGFVGGNWEAGLLAIDYRTGKREVIHEGDIYAIVPRRPVPLGQQPDQLFLFTGLAHLTINESSVWVITPDGPEPAKKVRDLPEPIERLFRLPDNSLLLHFHNADAPPATWTNHHPPLVLSPDGSLTRGCVEDMLAGAAPIGAAE